MADTIDVQDELLQELHQLRQRVSHSEELANQLQNSEAILRTIVSGTASTISGNFLQSLVCHLAAALEVPYAFITECADPVRLEIPKRVRTLAFWLGTEFGENFEYALTGTPCENVINGQSCCFHPDHIQSLFPTDQDLVKLEARSYIAVPLLDSVGKILGHLAVLDIKPMENQAHCEAILRIFAARAAAELERNQIEQEKEKLILELQDALTKIKTLRGLIPICASCKKIRDDQGAWNQLESYICEHTDAEFTHGICPPCARKLYPDLFDESEEI